MNTDISALKKPTKGKGDLPERGKKATKVIANDTRDKPNIPQFFKGVGVILKSSW